MSEQGLFNFRSESTHLRGTNISQPNSFIQRNYLGDQHLLSHRFPHMQYHLFYYQTQPAQEVRGHSINFHPPVTAPSYRVPANSPSSSSTSIQNAPFGFYMHQPPHHRGNMHGTAPGHWRNLPPVAFLQDDVMCHSLYFWYFIVLWISFHTDKILVFLNKLSCAVCSFIG